MATSQWHRFYVLEIAAPPELLFELLADLPGYRRWLPESDRFSRTDAEPYPVGLGTRYRDGRPDEPGKEWWGTVTGYRPPGSLDFQHGIAVRQLRAAIDVHFHYSLEPAAHGTRVSRWLVLDISMPWLLRPLRALVTRSFDRENVRTLAALRAYAESGSRAPPRA